MRKQETAKESTAGLQGKVQNLNEKVINQNKGMHRQTGGQHQFISRNCFAIWPKMVLCL